MLDCLSKATSLLNAMTLMSNRLNHSQDKFTCMGDGEWDMAEGQEGRGICHSGLRGPSLEAHLGDANPA